MSNCAVIRCPSDATYVFEIPNPDGPRLETIVCLDHQRRLDQGERWVWRQEPGSSSVLQMGEDLPLLLTEYEGSIGNLTSSGRSMILRLNLANPDGSSRYVDVEVSSTMGKDFGQFLVDWSHR